MDLYSFLKVNIKGKFFSGIIRENSVLKNKHRGERCFVLASGPSIQKQDLSFLQDEYVFALNNFYVHPDFKEIMSGKKDKYYMLAPIHPPQTDSEWLEWFSDMDKNTSNEIKFIFGVNSYRNNAYKLISRENLFKDKKNVYWYYAGPNFFFPNMNPAIDPSSFCLSANTVTVYALMYAIYMGFEEIYLVGADHNQMLLSEKNMCFYKGAIHKKNELKRTFKNNSKNKMFFKNMVEVFEQYEFFNEIHGGIFNLSSESTIDVFPYKDIESIKLDGISHDC